MTVSESEPSVETEFFREHRVIYFTLQFPSGEKEISGYWIGGEREDESRREWWLLVFSEHYFLMMHRPALLVPLLDGAARLSTFS